MELLPYSTEKVRLRNKNLFTSTVDNNEGHKRYFSSIDAEVYFGETFIDDINHIQYEVVEKVLPIYGFNSHKFDLLMNGTVIIQGEFTINFTKSGWLLDVISALGTTAHSNNGSVQQCQKRDTYCGSVGVGFFKGMFDIIVSFGDHNSTIQSFNSSAHMIKGVKITGYRQMLDVSGEPIAETYTFIAQDIVFNIDEINGLNNNFVGGNNDTTIDHTLSNKKSRMSLQLAYSLNNDDVITAQNAANKESALSLSVLCEHECNENNYGSLVTSLKILNNDIDKKDIKISKISIKPVDRRSDFKDLPVFKSLDYEYPYDIHRDILSTISLSNLITYDRQIYKSFKKLRNKAYIDAVMTIELTYKDTPFVLSNKPIKITPGSSYNF
jgi:hypothetical protein